MDNIMDNKTASPCGKYVVRTQLIYDNACPAPWVDDTCVPKNSVRFSSGRGKRAREVAIATDRIGDYLIFDAQAIQKSIVKDGGATRKQAHEQIQLMIKNWKGYLNNTWHYAGFIVSIYEKNDQNYTHELQHDSCWGFEFGSKEFDAYISECAADSASHMLATETTKRRGKWLARLKEVRQVKYWAQRDVITV